MDDPATSAVGEMIRKMMETSREASEKHIEDLMKKGQEETKSQMALMESRLMTKIDEHDEKWNAVESKANQVLEKCDELEARHTGKQDELERLHNAHCTVVGQRLHIVEQNQGAAWAHVLSGQQENTDRGRQVAEPVTPEPRRAMDERARKWEEKENELREARVILEKARRTVGFSPVLEGHINMQYKEGSGYEKKMAEGSEEALWMAAKMFMRHELRLKPHEIDAMTLVRAFQPRRENSGTVYVELKERKSVLDIYSCATHLKPGKELVNHIPPELHGQYVALDNLCYRWRQESNEKNEKQRTRIRVGEQGLEVWRKEGRTFNRVPRSELGVIPEINMQARRRGQQEDEDRPDPGPMPDGRGLVRERSQGPATPGSGSPPPKDPKMSTSPLNNKPEENEDEVNKLAKINGIKE